MKKALLFSTAVAVAVGSACALEPSIHPGKAFCGVAPDGSLAVSTLYGLIHIVNVETGQEFEYVEDEMISVGNGNFISNNGKVVGSKNEVAAVWSNGSWATIASAEDAAISYAGGITRDGSRIVGSIAPAGYDGMFEGTMLVPCYWDLQSDGTYGEVNYLPCPEKDFVGRQPQYITAISVSQDGKTVIGQVQDYSGFVIQPIVYKANDKGEWDYTLLIDELYHPEGFVLPEDPGDGPSAQPEAYMTEDELAAYLQAVQEYEEIYASLIYPEPASFMSDEEFAAYMAALEKYYETWDYADYPNEQDYMTEAEWNLYQQAILDYYEKMDSLVYPNAADYMGPESLAAYEAALKAVEEWDEKWMEFSDAFNRLCEMVPNFTFNNVLINGDGTKYASTTSSGDFFTGFNYIPCLLNLEDGTLKEFNAFGTSLIVSSMTDDGTLLAQKPGSFDNPMSLAYVKPADAEAFEPLHSYLASKNETIGDWIRDNLSHEFTMYVFNEETEEYEEVTSTEIITGIPFASADMSLIALGVENVWHDWDSDDEYYPGYGYLMHSMAWAGVKDAQTGSAAVRPLPGAALALTGDVEALTVFDLTGRVAFSVNAPDAIVSTGLAHGVYIVKAIATDGTVTVAKLSL